MVLFPGVPHSSTTAYPVACSASINVKYPSVSQIPLGSLRNSATAVAAPPAATITMDAEAVQHMDFSLLGGLRDSVRARESKSLREDVPVHTCPVSALGILDQGIFLKATADRGLLEVAEMSP